MSPRNYLTYTVLLLGMTAVVLYVGTWALALVARLAELQPGDLAFQVIMAGGLALIGALVLWSLTVMAAKRARDAHLPTVGFKAGVPALVLLDHFGAARLTDERLLGPLADFTPLVAFGVAAVFLFLLMAPRAPIKPLHGADEASDGDLVRQYG